MACLDYDAESFEGSLASNGDARLPPDADRLDVAPPEPSGLVAVRVSAAATSTPDGRDGRGGGAAGSAAGKNAEDGRGGLAGGGFGADVDTVARDGVVGVSRSAISDSSAVVRTRHEQRIRKVARAGRELGLEVGTRAGARAG